jgi:CheY-like chemotaxis protein
MRHAMSITRGAGERAGTHGGRDPDGDPSPEVLVVENDLDSREALTSLLEIEGLTVRCAECAGRALELLVAGVRPGSIILDLFTPGLSAEAFLRDKAAAPAPIGSIPVIAVSGDVEALARLGASVRHGGLAATMGKPFDIDELVARLRRLLPRSSGG